MEIQQNPQILSITTVDHMANIELEDQTLRVNLETDGLLTLPPAIQAMKMNPLSQWHHLEILLLAGVEGIALIIILQCLHYISTTLQQVEVLGWLLMISRYQLRIHYNVSPT
jgi:hypothetical protein